VEQISGWTDERIAMHNEVLTTERPHTTTTVPKQMYPYSVCYTL